MKRSILAYLVVFCSAYIALAGIPQQSLAETGTTGQPASQDMGELDREYRELREKLLSRYASMVDKIGKSEQNYISVFSVDEAAQGQPVQDMTPFSEDFTPWWSEEVGSQINPNPKGLNETISSLFTRAMNHSAQVKVFSDLPLIRETAIQETEGDFDIRLFAEGELSEIDEPVGDDLTTGGPERYEESSKSIEYGVKKKFLTGTEVELKQSIGDIDTNSIYFNPEEQARTGTHLIIRQPLLKQFGVGYQETPINLAKLDSAVSLAELQRQAESHLLEVARAYWSLYLERTLFLQKKQLLDKTNDILQQMEGRADVDVAPGLLARARSLVKAHKLGAIQSEYAMRNAQSRIHALVNDPNFLDEGGIELITSQKPQLQRLETSFDEVLKLALENRPEITQGIRQIQAATLREAKAKNELRPELNFVFDTWVKGLEGDYDYGTAYDNQFDEGQPSYLFGLTFEYPLGNNEAEARYNRKQIEMRQLLHQLDASVENVLLEVQVSYREIQKYHESVIQSYRIMYSDKEEIDELLSRIDYLLSKEEPYGDMLYRLMDASERLTRSEETFAKSELTYNLAIYNIYRAMGILVSKNNIVFERTEDESELPLLSPVRESQQAGETALVQ